MPLRRTSSSDLIALASLFFCAVIAAWPILRGGVLLYMDNPAHMAEVYALAHEAGGGWSDIAYCGFPLGSLHSPLWYGLLAMLARIGVPVATPYAALVLLGFVAPPAALYYVGRRTLSAPVAFALAVVLLLQRPAIIGVGSALGGMWTFYLSAAFLILIVDRLGRGGSGRRSLAGIAVLSALLGLTHLYAMVPLWLVTFLYAWLTVVRRTAPGREVSSRILAVGVGVLAASAYWVPLVLTRELTAMDPQNLGTSQALARLFVSTDLLDLVNGNTPALGVTAVLASLPMVALCVTGVAGAFMLGRRSDDTPLVGVLMSAALLLLLLVVVTEFNARFLGPNSWRMIYFVRVGLALGAVAAVGRLAAAPWTSSRATVTAGLIVALGWSLWFGLAARRDVPDPAKSMPATNAMWAWLAENRGDDWGRVYVQDTFSRTASPDGLHRSHVLALTSHRSGVSQLGAMYGVAPYATAKWTPSEFETLYRRAMNDRDDIDYLLGCLWNTNVTHIVTSDSSTAVHLDAQPEFSTLFAVGRYRVFRWLDGSASWTVPVVAGTRVEIESFLPGRIDVQAMVSGRRGDLLVKSTYHPHWRARGAVGASLAPSESGLLAINGLTPGRHRIALRYRPPRWPVWLSVAAWIAIAGLWWRPRRRTAGAVAAMAMVAALPAASLAADADADSAKSVDTVDRIASIVRPILEPAGGAFLFLPKVTYSTETSLGFGAEIGIPFRWGDGLYAADSDVVIAGRVTLKGQGDASTTLNLGWLDNRYTFKSKLEFDNIPRRFFGIGPDTPTENMEVYQRQSVLYYLEVFRRVTFKFRVGLRGEFEDNQMLEMEPGGLLDSGVVPGASTASIAGGGFLATWDSRNQRYAPAAGSLHQFFLMRFASLHDSEHDFLVFNADLRKYINVRGSDVLALQAFTYGTGGEVPFWRLAAVGGRSHSRGYRRGRYLDDVMVAVQAEYRKHVWWRFGTVIFGGLAQAAPRYSKLAFTNNHPTIGAGLRFRLGKDGMRARIDIAYGNELRAYFRIDEAF